MRLFKRNLFHKINRYIVIGFCSILISCISTTVPSKRREPTNFWSLSRSLLNYPDFDHFLHNGPFKFSIQKNFIIRVTDKSLVKTDLFTSRHPDQAPLVIIQHGNKSGKEFHFNQAKRLASWGFHVLVVQQPNQKRWIRNGVTLSYLVKLIYSWPRLLNKRIDVDNIILVGHSFGGSAIAIAAGKQAPIKGLVFLDPALVSTKVKTYLKAIYKPAVLLGADRRVFRSRKRNSFYKLIPGNILEVSIKNATHNDAQFPNQFSLSQTIGFAPSPSEENQERFTAAIVASVLSLTTESSLKYAKNVFKQEVKAGYMKKQRSR